MKGGSEWLVFTNALGCPSREPGNKRTSDKTTGWPIKTDAKKLASSSRQERQARGMRARRASVKT